MVWFGGRAWTKEVVGDDGQRKLDVDKGDADGEDGEGEEGGDGCEDGDWEGEDEEEGEKHDVR